ncbi:MAG: ribosome maturation factor RimP [Actinobacteria bacterium]|nr:ribosome maturation factor RimP [Actinomycetota bacterium]
MTNIQAEIEAKLAETQPAVEVLAVEQAGSGVVRVVIDHPDGVTLDLCAAVTGELDEVREQVGVEVASPGRERPLSRPEHFQRFLGRRARVRTRESLEGHKSFTGELVGASNDEVTISAGDSLVAIPYAAIKRSNLVEE